MPGLCQKWTHNLTVEGSSPSKLTTKTKIVTTLIKPLPASEDRIAVLNNQAQDSDE